MPAVVPVAELPEGASQKLPQPAIPPSAIIKTAALNIDCQLRLRAGIPRKIRSASSAPAPVPPNISPRLFPRRSGSSSWPLVAAVVLIAMVVLWLVVVELNVTVVLAMEHPGRSTAFEGLDVVSEQAKVTMPAYPPVALTARVEAAELPGATAAGVVAFNVNVPEEVLPVTVTDAVPVAEA